MISRTSPDDPRTELQGGFLHFLLRLFACAGGTMDPNG
jgi:hypothetical protein